MLEKTEMSPSKLLSVTVIGREFQVAGAEQKLTGFYSASSSA